MKKLMKRLTLFTAYIGASALISSAAAVTIKHDEGVSQINGIPQRVVVLDEESLGMMYALGLGDKVVGVGGPRLSNLALQLGNKIPQDVRNTGFLAEGKLNPAAKYVGNWTTPNLETITALKPDLIVHLTWDGNQNYNQLSKIAPTIGYSASTDRQDWLRDLGRIFHKSNQAEAMISKVKAAQIKARNQLQAAGVFKKYPKILSLSPFEGGTVYVNNKSRFIEDFKAMGFKNAYKNEKDLGVLGIGEVVSPEYLLTVSPDTLVVLTGSSDEASRQFLNSSVGKRLKDQTILYQRPKYSPWTGPLVSLNTINTIKEKAIQMVK